MNISIVEINKKIRLLVEKREAMGFDIKQEQGTYNQGYYEALSNLFDELVK